MDKLPTIAYYHEQVKDEYKLIVQSQNILTQRMRKTLLKEWSETEKGKAFVQSLYDLRPENGLISTTYELQTPVDTADVWSSLEDFFGKNTPEYLLFGKLTADGDRDKTLGTKRLKITLGCWEIQPMFFTNHLNEVFLRMYFD